MKPPNWAKISITIILTVAAGTSATIVFAYREFETKERAKERFEDVKNSLHRMEDKLDKALGLK